MSAENCATPDCNGRNLCLKHKLRAWREEGATPFSLPGHFKAANRGGYTQSELAKEIFDTSREHGVDIQRVR